MEKIQFCLGGLFQWKGLIIFGLKLCDKLNGNFLPIFSIYFYFMLSYLEYFYGLNKCFLSDKNGSHLNTWLKNIKLIGF